MAYRGFIGDFWRVCKQSLTVGIPKLELGNETKKAEGQMPFGFCAIRLFTIQLRIVVAYFGYRLRSA